MPRVSKRWCIGASCLLVANKMILSLAATREAWMRHPRRHYRAWRKLTGSALLLFLRWGKHLCCAIAAVCGFHALPRWPDWYPQSLFSCIWMSSSLMPWPSSESSPQNWCHMHGECHAHEVEATEWINTPKSHLKAKKWELWSHIEEGRSWDKC